MKNELAFNIFRYVQVVYQGSSHLKIYTPTWLRIYLQLIFAHDFVAMLFLVDQSRGILEFRHVSLFKIMLFLPILLLDVLKSSKVNFLELKL